MKHRKILVYIASTAHINFKEYIGQMLTLAGLDWEPTLRQSVADLVFMPFTTAPHLTNPGEPAIPNITTANNPIAQKNQRYAIRAYNKMQQMQITRFNNAYKNRIRHK